MLCGGLALLVSCTLLTGVSMSVFVDTFVLLGRNLVTRYQLLLTYLGTRVIGFNGTPMAEGWR